ncbi:Monooxygenase [Planctomycetales bacterium 10988]|nr:Monooxygenase [Planctomycetales bacterium 10988]
MAVDAPARIAILGAGPIGLETALYARFLGYNVDVYEQGRVGENMLQWGHVRMFSPFTLNRSSLAIMALQIHDEQQNFPDDQALLTGKEYVEQFLQPLAKTDLLLDCIQEQTKVIAVSHNDLLKGDLVGDEEREEYDFRLLLEKPDGSESIASAEVVIDTTGTFGNPNWLGSGGIPALGERKLSSRIHYQLPDLLGTDRNRYANQKVLLIGSGYSAATNLLNLIALAEQEPQTEITWLTRKESQEPIARFPEDSLKYRDELAEKVNQLASNPPKCLTFHPGATVETICSSESSSARLTITTNQKEIEPFDVNEIIANVGFRPDWEMVRECQMHLCYATEGPMKLAASLMQNESADCLQQTSAGVESLLNPEAHFYVLGSKSYGRNTNFLIQQGLNQVRELFTLIGDRAELDLYASAAEKIK